jgi:glucosylceramidase
MEKKNTKRILILLIIGFMWVSCNSTSVNKDHFQQTEPAKANFSFQTAEQYLTAKADTPFFQMLETLTFMPLKQPNEYFPTLIINPKKTFQTIEGFGGALTDAAAETIYKLSAANQERIFNAYFDKDKGIGYTLFRTSINSCDFSSESYAYAEVAGDVNLEHFSIEKDRKFRIPLIKEAVKRVGTDFKLLASPWSPPAWMKSNKHMLQGGKLKPEYYQTWANYYV